MHRVAASPPRAGMRTAISTRSGRLAAALRERLATSSRLAHHFQPNFASQDAAQPSPCELVVVHDQEPRRGRSWRLGQTLHTATASRVAGAGTSIMTWVPAPG